MPTITMSGWVLPGVGSTEQIRWHGAYSFIDLETRMSFRRTSSLPQQIYVKATKLRSTVDKNPLSVGRLTFRTMRK
jgi:hypothetical protein